MIPRFIAHHRRFKNAGHVVIRAVYLFTAVVVNHASIPVLYGQTTRRVFFLFDATLLDARLCSRLVDNLNAFKGIMSSFFFVFLR